MICIEFHRDRDRLSQNVKLSGDHGGSNLRKDTPPNSLEELRAQSQDPNLRTVTVAMCEEHVMFLGWYLLKAPPLRSHFIGRSLRCRNGTNSTKASAEEINGDGSRASHELGPKSGHLQVTCARHDQVSISYGIGNVVGDFVRDASA